MENPSEQQVYSKNLLTFFFIWMACFALANLSAAGLVVAVFGREGYQAFSQDMNFTPDKINFLKWLQIFISIGIFGLPPLIFALIKKEKFRSYFSLDKVPPLNLSFMTLAIVVLSGPLIFWVLEVNQEFTLPDSMRQLEQYLKEMEEKNEHLLKAILEMNSVYDFALNMLMVAVVPAVVEELLFRGALQKLLRGLFQNVHIAIFVTGAFFSFIHFQFYGFLPRMFLGILFGYLLFWSGNLWLPILAHFIHNGAQVVMIYLYKVDLMQTDIEEMDTIPPYVIMISTILFFASLYFFDKLSAKDVVKNEPV